MLVLTTSTAMGTAPPARQNMEVEASALFRWEILQLLCRADRLETVYYRRTIILGFMKLVLQNVNLD